MKRQLVFTFLIFFTCSSIAQDLSQSYLNGLEDEELLEKFNEVDNDSVIAEKVARTYLDRGILRKDTIMMARGYDRLARIFNPKTNIRFADSIIEITINSQHITYPTLAYIIKAFQYGELKNLEKEYANLLEAYELARNKSNLSHQVYVLHRMIFAQAKWGDSKKALELQVKRHKVILSKKYLGELKKSSRKEVQSDINNLYLEEKFSSYESFIFCYLTLQDYDLANEYAEKLRIQLEGYGGVHLKYHTNWLFESQMEIAYHRGNYGSSIKSAERLKSAIDINTQQIVNKNLNLFQGLSMLKLGRNRDGIKHLLLADSIYDSNFDNLNLHYDRLLFESLFKYYSSRKEVSMKLKYLDKLLIIDSILKINYQFFEPEHIRKFETPILLAKKEELIAQLEEDNKRSRNQSWWTVGVLLVSLLTLGYYFNRQLIYKRRFSALLNSEQRYDQNLKNEDKYEISSEVVNHILERLKRFEEGREFLIPDITLQSLAKKFHTNSNYLSRVINLKIGKNFSQYIHDLRIEYSMRDLLPQQKFRNYTIKAIAEECGYTNAESFSRAFYKKNGIYPSYYIKKLNKSAI